MESKQAPVPERFFRFSSKPGWGETWVSRSGWLLGSSKRVSPTLFFCLTDFGFKDLFALGWEHMFPPELQYVICYMCVYMYVCVYMYTYNYSVFFQSIQNTIQVPYPSYHSDPTLVSLLLCSLCSSHTEILSFPWIQSWSLLQGFVYAISVWSLLSFPASISTLNSLPAWFFLPFNSQLTWHFLWELFHEYPLDSIIELPTHCCPA